LTDATESIYHAGFAGGQQEAQLSPRDRATAGWVTLTQNNGNAVLKRTRNAVLERIVAVRSVETRL